MKAKKTLRRKLISILLVVVMCLGMTISASASSLQSAAAGPYSITIEESSFREEYTAYKVFDLTYSKSDPSAVAYTIDSSSPWYAYLTSYGDNCPFEFEQVNNSTTYNVSWKETISDSFAKSFFQHVSEDTEFLDSLEGRSDVYTGTADNWGTAVIDVDEAGYYFVSTSLGTMVMVDSTTPDVTIVEKNDIPSLEKEELVYNEVTGTWDTKESVNVGDILEFEIFIENVYGQKTMALHDHMSSGLMLEYDPDSEFDLNTEDYIHTIRVYVGEVEGGYQPGDLYNREDIDWQGPLLPAKDAESLESEHADFIVHVGDGTGEYDDDGNWVDDSFELEFSEEFLNTLTENSVIRVIYYAEVVGSDFNEEYQDFENNYAFVSYGVAGRTDYVFTYAESYGFDLQKADGEWLIGGQQFEDGYDSHLLAGAEFELYHAEVVYDDEKDPFHDYPDYVAGDQVQFIHTTDPVTDTEGNEHPADGYRVADEEDDEDAITDTIVIKDGEVSIYGIAAGNYILRETKAPEGYVLPDKDILIQIVEEIVEIQDGVVYEVVEHIYVDGEEITDEEHSKVVIANEGGDLLVETGGIGTTIFTVTGLAIIAGAAGLMYINRRRRVRT